MRDSGTPPLALALAKGFPPADAAGWRSLVAKLLGADGLERLTGLTDDGIPLPPLHAPALGTAPADAAPVGGWPPAVEIAQPCAHPDPDVAARRIADDLEGGAEAAVVRLDRVLGRGGDRPDGVLAYDRPALDRLLAGLDPGGAAILLEPGERALDVAEELEALAEARRTPAGARSFRVLADPIGAALEGASGDPAARIAAAAAALLRRPSLGLLADGRPWHEAGASEAQEVAAVLASALTWLRAAERAGAPLEGVVPRLELVLAVDDDLFLSLAKLRAARLAFERVLDAAGLGPLARSVRLRAETGQRMLARLDPWVNVLRTTVAAMAAILGGADAVTVQPLDRPLGEPGPLARRIARNIPLILREEVGAGRVADPAAGSWHVAHLTRSLAEAAWQRLQDLEARGGLLEALATGRPQAEVEEVRRARAARLARGEPLLTGVSAFPALDETPPPAEPFDPAAAIAAARSALASRPSASGAAPFPPLRPGRWAEPFEALRARAEAARARAGERPSVLVVGLGRSGELHELLTWAENLVAVGGIGAVRAVVASPGEAAEAFGRSGRRLAIGCLGASARAAAGELLAALRQAGARRVWLAGGDEAGPGRLGPGLDMLAFLEELHGLLGTPEAGTGAAA